jgi:uncharacterized protein
MKYLVLLIVLVVAIGFWRNKRESSVAVHTPPANPPKPQDMVACAHCGLHLPYSDAVVQRGMTYCCAEHLSAGPALRP